MPLVHADMPMLSPGLPITQAKPTNLGFFSSLLLAACSQGLCACSHPGCPCGCVRLGCTLPERCLLLNNMGTTSVSVTLVLAEHPDLMASALVRGRLVPTTPYPQAL